MGINIQEIQAKLANRPKSNSSGERADLKWFKLPKDGEAKVIFLPPTNDATVPGILQYTHWNVPEVGHLTCLRTFDKPCPVCEALKEIQNKASEDILKQFQSVGRAHHNVLVLGDNNYATNEPCIMSSGEYTYWWLLEQILNQEVGDITNPNAAHSVTFKRTTPGGRFDRIISLRAIPIADTEEGIKAILSKAANLQAIWKYTPELEGKLKTAASVIVNDILEKTKLISDPSPNKIPTPTALQTPVTPSEDVSVAPNPVPTPKPAPVAQPASTSTASQPIMNVNPENPLDKPKCFGQYKGADNSACQLCCSELECEQATKKV